MLILGFQIVSLSEFFLLTQNKNHAVSHCIHEQNSKSNEMHRAFERNHSRTHFALGQELEDAVDSVTDAQCDGSQAQDAFENGAVKCPCDEEQRLHQAKDDQKPAERQRLDGF